MSGTPGAFSPPTGTVTCLFTDIEGSTRLEIDLGTGPYRDIRERHRDLLRAAFTAHEGHEQGTEGDSFFVIFRGAIEAVAAAAGDVAGITLILDDLASIAVNAGDPPRAGRLFGAARHLQATSGSTLAMYAEETYSQFNVPSPRSVLSPEDFERYVAEGAAMGLDEAVAYALEDPARVP